MPKANNINNHSIDYTPSPLQRPNQNTINRPPQHQKNPHWTHPHHQDQIHLHRIILNHPPPSSTSSNFLSSTPTDRPTYLHAYAQQTPQPNTGRLTYLPPSANP
ncbi:uncharacterized protein BO80DRAFT_429790 [Aspergillus ibericus CBS 121593]|uniref:Uncharacterized protein n=1 Tax=Aspergillus ibericus CBS 121593 TaxID=1448316 RepID=A0A395GK05_9EURO|nr:hypothetical protein BO80DRAFT_429790 [Aspergillus ibericus CBS 121593]RAK95556.1 hypothetical protein BO80DRAFT_429790 [Aspergillus ibericus CBS 121593]